MALEKTLLIYMSKEDAPLIKRIEKDAKDNERSVSGQIKFMIRKHFKAEDKKK